MPFVDGEVEVFGLSLGLALGNEEECENAAASEEKRKDLDYQFSCHGCADFEDLRIMSRKRKIPASRAADGERMREN